MDQSSFSRQLIGPSLVFNLLNPVYGAEPAFNTLTNVSVPDPAYQSDTTQPQSIISNLKARGYEFELLGGVTPGLSVVASATFLRERDSPGRHVRGLACRNAALLGALLFRNVGAPSAMPPLSGHPKSQEVECTLVLCS